MTWKYRGFRVNVMLGTSQLLHCFIKLLLVEVLDSTAVSYMVLMKGIREKCYRNIYRRLLLLHHG